MNKRSFLLEIGLEEMPARFVTNSMNQLGDKVEEWLKEYRLSYDNVHTFSTPRRLAVLIEGLVEKQGDIEEEAKGPSKKIALDAEGNWSKAAAGFSRGQGVTVEDLYIQEVKGEEYIFVKKFTEGKSTSELLTALKDVITSLQFPKNMKWGTQQLRFVRPIKWLVALFGEEVIPFEITNVKTNNVTRGHRFLGRETTLGTADDYTKVLLSEFVIVDPVERKKAVHTQIELIAEGEGWKVPIDESLLEEVNNLVEYPTALYGQFDKKYLDVPEEVLITSMREHQRYFPVKDVSGDLLPYFITVRNGDHRHLENVQKGNEKVLRARLADAEFFYNEDLKHPLEDGLKRLESIVYHEDLGSLGDKVRRIKELAVSFGKKFDLNANQLEKVERVSHLCKADLVTHMVNEFPELEGKMGEDYALKSGEDEQVAKAIYEHYLPKQAGDRLPSSEIGAIVSIADKMDTVITSFGIGLIPTGSQDPHGLRRQTAGIVQILIGNDWNVNIIELFKEGIKLSEKRGLLKRNPEVVMEDIGEFLKLRLKNILQERGVRYDVVDSVLKMGIENVQTLVKKAHFLMDQHNTQEFKSVVEAFSRVTNIAKKANDSVFTLNVSLLKEKEEQELNELSVEISKEVSNLLKKGQIEQAYIQLKRLVPAITNYFDNIMVMAEDTTIKNNRLAQMSEVSKLITTFSDFQSIVFHSEG